MADKEWEVWELVIEIVTVIAAAVYLGLQIYGAYIYESGITVFFHNLLPLLILYAGMVVLQRFPELLNGWDSEPLSGKIRTYAVRMVRNCRLFVVMGMLFPSAADALGVQMSGTYSLFIIGSILGTIAYYLYRIYRYNSENERRKR